MAKANITETVNFIADQISPLSLTLEWGRMDGKVVVGVRRTDRKRLFKPSPDDDLGDPYFVFKDKLVGPKRRAQWVASVLSSLLQKGEIYWPQSDKIQFSSVKPV